MTTSGQFQPGSDSNAQPGISNAQRKQRLRAPAEHGESLQVPLLADAGQLLSENSARFEAGISIGGQTPAELREAAQHELVSLAREHTGSYCDSLPEFENTSGIILSGHQPGLFHPGVWFKNFALSWLAARHQLTAINLVVDSEECSSVAIDVPSGTVQSPHTTPVSFDSMASGLPYETTTLCDPELFSSFSDRVEQHVAELNIGEPLLKGYWPVVQNLAKRSTNLGFLIAAARHTLELSNGLKTLEVPLSSVCETESFAAFAAHLLANIPDFSEKHNGSLADYRRENRLRSKTHPVPDLRIEGSRFETPLWIWSKQSPQRQPLFVTWSPESVLLEGPSLDREVPHDQLADALMQLGSEGFAIRSRALLTTMYARLVLCDAFIHGIGGAKYDEVTDRIIESFFGITPPQFVTVTATQHLPLSLPAVEPDDIRDVEQQLRNLRFHPEKQFTGNSTAPAIQELIETKRELISQKPPRGSGRPRHDQINRINEELSSHLETAEAELQKRRAILQSDLKRKRVLASREFSFCLFPAESVFAGLQNMLPNKPANTPPK